MRQRRVYFEKPDTPGTPAPPPPPPTFAWHLSDKAHTRAYVARPCGRAVVALVAQAAIDALDAQRLAFAAALGSSNRKVREYAAR